MEIFSVHTEVSVARYEHWFTVKWLRTEQQSCFTCLICYYPSFDVGKGAAPDLWFHLVSSAPAAVETNVLDVEGDQSVPQGPESRSRSNFPLLCTRHENILNIPMFSCNCDNLKLLLIQCYNGHFYNTSDYTSPRKEMLTSSLPPKNSRHIAAGRGHSRCCCPEAERGSVSFACDQDRSPSMNRDGPPTLTPSSWRANWHHLTCIY